MKEQKRQARVRVRWHHKSDRQTNAGETSSKTRPCKRARERQREAEVIAYLDGGRLCFCVYARGAVCGSIEIVSDGGGGGVCKVGADSLFRWETVEVDSKGRGGCSAEERARAEVAPPRTCACVYHEAVCTGTCMRMRV